MVDAVNVTDDWFFGHLTPECSMEKVDYSHSIQPMDIAARITMTVLYLVCFGCVLAMPRRQENVGLPTEAPTEVAALKSFAGASGRGGGSGESSSTGAGTGSGKARWVFLDVARIVCVVCVVTEHSGGTEYSHNNSLFVTEWVLQFLFTISGICFMMSKASFGTYMVRYSAVFFFGVACNVIGDAIARPGWYNDLGNTVFQMFYVVFLIACSACAWPLRTAMRGEDDPFGGGHSLCGLSDRLAAVLLYNSIFFVSFVLYVCGVDVSGLIEALLSDHAQWSTAFADVMLNIFYIVSHIFSIAALASLHIYLRRTPASAEVLSWIFFVIIYLPIVLFPTPMAYAPQCALPCGPWIASPLPRAAPPASLNVFLTRVVRCLRRAVTTCAGVMLYALGLYVSTHHFYGHATIRETVMAYWLFFLVMMLSVSMPDLRGRCDRYPPDTLWERFRWYVVEALLQLGLLTRTFSAADPMDLNDSLGWWALWAFCAHVMFARTLPVPYGAVTTYLTVIPFLVVCKCVRPTWKREPRRPSPAAGSEPMLAEASLAPAAAAPPSQSGLYGTFFGGGGAARS